MCVKDGLVKYTRLLCLIQIPAFFAAFIVSSIGAADDVVKIAFGNQAVRRFGGLILISLSCIASSYCGIFGSKNHNKFCLLIFTIYMFLCFMIVMILESITTQEMAILHDEKLQLNCSYGFSSDNSLSNECKQYLSDPRTNSFREMWYQVFIKTLDGDPKWTQVLEDIQSMGQCCGFDPPYRCWFGENIKGSPPGNDSSNPGICGEEPGWYPPTFDCNIEVIDIPGVIYHPGCPFHMPGGTCLKFGYNLGCAYTTQIWAMNQVLPLFKALRILFVFGIISGLCSLCLCLKRKENDVLPTTYVKYRIEQDQKLQAKENRKFGATVTLNS